MMREGERYGHLLVLDVMSGGDVGKPDSGQWVQVKCDCSRRLRVPVREIRRRARLYGPDNLSCGCASTPAVQAMATMRRVRNA